MKKFSILAAVFLLIFTFATPNFVSAANSDLENSWQYNGDDKETAEKYINKIVQTSPHKKI